MAIAIGSLLIYANMLFEEKCLSPKIILPWSRRDPSSFLSSSLPGSSSLSLVSSSQDILFFAFYLLTICVISWIFCSTPSKYWHSVKFMASSNCLKISPLISILAVYSFFSSSSIGLFSNIFKIEAIISSQSETKIS